MQRIDSTAVYLFCFFLKENLFYLYNLDITEINMPLLWLFAVLSFDFANYNYQNNIVLFNFLGPKRVKFCSWLLNKIWCFFFFLQDKSPVKNFCLAFQRYEKYLDKMLPFLILRWEFRLCFLHSLKLLKFLSEQWTKIWRDTQTILFCSFLGNYILETINGLFYHQGNPLFCEFYVLWKEIKQKKLINYF